MILLEIVSFFAQNFFAEKCQIENFYRQKNPFSVFDFDKLSTRNGYLTTDFVSFNWFYIKLPIESVRLKEIENYLDFVCGKPPSMSNDHKKNVPAFCLRFHIFFEKLIA